MNKLLCIFLIVFCASFAHAQKQSDFPTTTSVSPTDFIPYLSFTSPSTYVNKKITWQNVFNSGLTLNGVTINGYPLTSPITLTLSDIVTLPSDATQFLNGTGAFSTPSGGGGVHLYQVADANARFAGTYNNGDVVQEIGQSETFTVQVTGDTGGSLQSTYFLFDGLNGADALDTYVWYNVDGGGTDPAPAATGIEVDISINASASDVVTTTANAMANSGSNYQAFFIGNNTLEFGGQIPGIAAPPQDVSTGFVITETAAGEAATNNWYIVVDNSNTSGSAGFTPIANNITVGAMTLDGSGNLVIIPVSSSGGANKIVATDGSGNTTVSNLTVTGTAAIELVTSTFGFRVTGGGSGIQIKEGSSCKQGTATLVAGTVTVSNTSVTSSSRIFVSGGALHSSTAIGQLSVPTQTASTSFVITSYVSGSTSTQTGDLRTVNYEIFEPSP